MAIFKIIFSRLITVDEADVGIYVALYNYRKQTTINYQFQKDSTNTEYISYNRSQFKAHTGGLTTVNEMSLGRKIGCLFNHWKLVSV